MRSASFADGCRHCFLGESTPFGVEEAAVADGAAKNGSRGQRFAPYSNALVMSSLQRLVELHFVYSEVLTILRNLFRNGYPEIEGVGDWHSRMMTRSVVVAEIFTHARNGDVAEGFFPREAVLLRLLDLPNGLQDGIAQAASPATFAEVVRDMAENFECACNPSPEELLWEVGEMLGPDSQSSEPVSTESNSTPLKGAGGVADKRKRDKKARGR